MRSVWLCAVATACGSSSHLRSAPQPALAPLAQLAAPRVFVSGQPEPDAIVVDATTVYWATGKTIWRASRAGGAPEQLAQTTTEVGEMTADATDLYAATIGDSYKGPLDAGEIVRIPKSGGAPRVLGSGLQSPGGVAIDDHEVYVTDHRGGIGFDTPNGVVRAIPKDGGTGRVLADHQTAPYRLAIDRGTAYFLTYGGNHALVAVPTAGGAATVLADDLGTADGLAFVGDAIAVSTNGHGVVAISRAGGAPRTLVDMSCDAIASDGVTLYVRTAAGAVLELPPSGPPRVIAVDRASFYEPLVIADHELWWPNRTTGEIRRADRATSARWLGSLEHHAGAAIVDGDDVVFLDTDDGISGDTRKTPDPDLVVRAPAAGGTARVIGSAPGALRGLAANRGGVYSIDDDAHIVRWFPRDGSAARTIGPSSRCFGGLAATADAVYVSACNDGVHRIAADGADTRVAPGSTSRLFAAGDAIVAVDASGISIVRGTALSSLVADPAVEAIAVDATQAYWTSGRHLLRIALTGGAPVVVATLPADWRITSLAVDGDTLIAGDDAGTVTRIDRDGQRTALAVGLGTIGSVAAAGGTAFVPSETLKLVLGVSRK